MATSVILLNITAASPDLLALQSITVNRIWIVDCYLIMSDSGNRQPLIDWLIVDHGVQMFACVCVFSAGERSPLPALGRHVGQTLPSGEHFLTL